MNIITHFTDPQIREQSTPGGSCRHHRQGFSRDSGHSLFYRLNFYSLILVYRFATKLFISSYFIIYYYLSFHFFIFINYHHSQYLLIIRDARRTKERTVQ